MTRPLVLLDVDGVLANFIDAALDVVASVTGKIFEPHHVTEFDFCAALGLTAAEAGAVKRAIGDRENFAARLQPFTFAIEGVSALREVADIHIVTSPWNSNRTWTHDREAWLAHHFEIHHSDVTHTSKKLMLRGDFLVDDKTETCQWWQATNPSGIAVQWQTPHNRRDGWQGPSTCDWAELVEMVRGAS